MIKAARGGVGECRENFIHLFLGQDHMIKAASGGMG